VRRSDGLAAGALSIFDLRTETTERAASVRTACTADALMEAVDGVVESLKAGGSGR
jgi:hypothetical protein